VFNPLLTDIDCRNNCPFLKGLLHFVLNRSAPWKWSFKGVSMSHFFTYRRLVVEQVKIVGFHGFLVNTVGGEWQLC